MSETQKFDVEAVLKNGEQKLAPMLDQFTLAQLKALEVAERGKGATSRAGVLRRLQAEIDARASMLSDESVELLAAAAHSICHAEPAWADVGEDQRGEALNGVLVVLTAPQADRTDLFERAVLALAPLFNQIEGLLAEVDALTGVREPKEIGPGTLAEIAKDGTKPEALLKKIARLAFCEGSDIRFEIDASGNDFEAVEGLPTRYRKRVVLRRDKPRVRIDTVAALDAEGRPIAKVTWPRPLEGGGGREAAFPAGSIAFAL